VIYSPEACALLSLALVGASPVGAQDATVLAELHPGAVEHRDAPLTLELRPGRELPADFDLGGAWSASVTGVDASLAAQANLTLDADGQPRGLVVSWMEPHLPADEMVRRAVTVGPAADAAEPGFRFLASEGQLELSFEDQPVWRDETVWDPERYPSNMCSLPTRRCS